MAHDGRRQVNRNQNRAQAARRAKLEARMARFDPNQKNAKIVLVLPGEEFFPSKDGSTCSVLLLSCGHFALTYWEGDTRPSESDGFPCVACQTGLSAQQMGELSR